MKIVSIVGARPQLIKMATLHRAFSKHQQVQHIIVHTGQHYDYNMSEIFFKDLEIPEPDYNLRVGSYSHGKQTGLMLMRIEQVLIKESPEYVIVYGDTNSILAGAIGAVKLHIKVAHVEAGLRSLNRRMPEEINRIATDHISGLLFAPTENAMHLLANEGLKDKSFSVGDVMFDSVLFYKSLTKKKYRLSDITSLKDFYLATIHRAENTEDINRLRNIFKAFSELDLPVIVPLHPRTQKVLSEIEYVDNVEIINPVGYLELLILLKNCRKVLTDSGGLQKEAYFLKKPCITLRNETEWIETLENNCNTLVGANTDKIIEAVKSKTNKWGIAKKFGYGNASEKIIKILLKETPWK